MFIWKHCLAQMMVKLEGSKEWEKDGMAIVEMYSEDGVRLGWDTLLLISETTEGMRDLVRSMQEDLEESNYKPVLRIFRERGKEIEECAWEWID